MMWRRKIFQYFHYKICNHNKRRM